MSLGRERFELASLGDLMQLLVDGWRIDRLHYADRSGAAAPRGLRGPRARGGRAARRLRPRRRPRAVASRPRGTGARDPGHLEAPLGGHDPPARHRRGDAPDEWGPVPEPFPQALVFGPSTLRAVVAVNQLQSVAGLDIALTSLERHDGGARLRFMCRASDAATRRRMSVLDVIAVDDAARLYRVACPRAVPRAIAWRGRSSWRRRSPRTSGC